MKTHQLMLSLVAVALVFNSCKKNDTDETKPTAIVHTPANGDTIYSAAGIDFNADFSDDTGLNQYKIDIHSDFDGHTHGKTAAGEPWEAVIIDELSGANDNIQRNIEVPDTVVAGEYHFIVACLDKSGNESELVEVDIFILNSTDTAAPVVTLDHPSNNDQFNAGDIVYIVGAVTDNQEVEAVDFEIQREGSDTLAFDYEQVVEAQQADIYHEVHTNGWSAGTYHLHITAVDHLNNQSELEREFVVN